MKHYLIVDYTGLDDSIELKILSTEHERGTEKFNELLESYETNNNCILCKEIDDIEEVQDQFDKFLTRLDETKLAIQQEEFNKELLEETTYPKPLLTYEQENLIIEAGRDK